MDDHQPQLRPMHTANPSMMVAASIAQYRSPRASTMNDAAVFMIASFLDHDYALYTQFTPEQLDSLQSRFLQIVPINLPVPYSSRLQLIQQRVARIKQVENATALADDKLLEAIRGIGGQMAGCPCLTTDELRFALYGVFRLSRASSQIAFISFAENILSGLTVLAFGFNRDLASEFIMSHIRQLAELQPGQGISVSVALTAGTLLKIPMRIPTAFIVAGSILVRCVRSDVVRQADIEEIAALVKVAAHFIAQSPRFPLSRASPQDDAAQYDAYRRILLQFIVSCLQYGPEYDIAIQLICNVSTVMEQHISQYFDQIQTHLSRAHIFGRQPAPNFHRLRCIAILACLVPSRHVDLVTAFEHVHIVPAVRPGINRFNQLPLWIQLSNAVPQFADVIKQKLIAAASQYIQSSAPLENELALDILLSPLLIDCMCSDAILNHCHSLAHEEDVSSAIKSKALQVLALGLGRPVESASKRRLLSLLAESESLVGGMIDVISTGHTAPVKDSALATASMLTPMMPSENAIRFRDALCQVAPFADHSRPVRERIDALEHIATAIQFVPRHLAHHFSVFVQDAAAELATAPSPCTDPAVALGLVKIIHTAVTNGMLQSSDYALVISAVLHYVQPTTTVLDPPPPPAEICTSLMSLLTTINETELSDELRSQVGQAISSVCAFATPGSSENTSEFIGDIQAVSELCGMLHEEHGAANMALSIGDSILLYLVCNPQFISIYAQAHQLYHNQLASTVIHTVDSNSIVDRVIDRIEQLPACLIDITNADCSDQRGIDSVASILASRWSELIPELAEMMPYTAIARFAPLAWQGDGVVQILAPVVLMLVGLMCTDVDQQQRFSDALNMVLCTLEHLQSHKLRSMYHSFIRLQELLCRAHLNANLPRHRIIQLDLINCAAIANNNKHYSTAIIFAQLAYSDCMSMSALQQLARAYYESGHVAEWLGAASLLGRPRWPRDKSHLLTTECLAELQPWSILPDTVDRLLANRRRRLADYTRVPLTDEQLHRLHMVRVAQYQRLGMFDAAEMHFITHLADKVVDWPRDLAWVCALALLQSSSFDVLHGFLSCIHPQDRPVFQIFCDVHQARSFAPSRTLSSMPSQQQFAQAYSQIALRVTSNSSDGTSSSNFNSGSSSHQLCSLFYAVNRLQHAALYNNTVSNPLLTPPPLIIDLHIDRVHRDPFTLAIACAVPAACYARVPWIQLARSQLAHGIPEAVQSTLERVTLHHYREDQTEATVLRIEADTLLLRQTNNPDVATLSHFASAADEYRLWAAPLEFIVGENDSSLVTDGDRSRVRTALAALHHAIWTSTAATPEIRTIHRQQEIELLQENASANDSTAADWAIYAHRLHSRIHDSCSPLPVDLDDVIQAYIVTIQRQHQEHSEQSTINLTAFRLARLLFGSHCHHFAQRPIIHDQLLQLPLGTWQKDVLHIMFTKHHGMPSQLQLVIENIVYALATECPHSIAWVLLCSVTESTNSSTTQFIHNTAAILEQYHSTVWSGYKLVHQQLLQLARTTTEMLCDYYTASDRRVLFNSEWPLSQCQKQQLVRLAWRICTHDPRMLCDSSESVDSGNDDDSVFVSAILADEDIGTSVSRCISLIPSSSEISSILPVTFSSSMIRRARNFNPDSGIYYGSSSNNSNSSNSSNSSRRRSRCRVNGSNDSTLNSSLVALHNGSGLGGTTGGTSVLFDDNTTVTDYDGNGCCASIIAQYDGCGLGPSYSNSACNSDTDSFHTAVDCIEMDGDDTDDDTDEDGGNTSIGTSAYAGTFEHSDQWPISEFDYDIIYGDGAVIIEQLSNALINYSAIDSDDNCSILCNILRNLFEYLQQSLDRSSQTVDELALCASTSFGLNAHMPTDTACSHTQPATISRLGEAAVIQPGLHRAHLLTIQSSDGKCHRYSVRQHINSSIEHAIQQSLCAASRVLEFNASDFAHLQPQPSVTISSYDITRISPGVSLIHIPDVQLLDDVIESYRQRTNSTTSPSPINVPDLLGHWLLQHTSMDDVVAAQRRFTSSTAVNLVVSHIFALGDRSTVNFGLSTDGTLMHLSTLQINWDARPDNNSTFLPCVAAEAFGRPALEQAGTFSVLAKGTLDTIVRDSFDIELVMTDHIQSTDEWRRFTQRLRGCFPDPAQEFNADIQPRSSDEIIGHYISFANF
ncbi:hypothetical protein GQ42DRAFT_12315 [Ramicandelaber brevisporus]|nr:hypothetical protein GQ42DRAFT_12315 [Ramicandelaber brevisporus]